MLKSYRSTPHPATGIPPGCMMFRGGYRSGFPRFNITEESKLAGHAMDSDNRKERKEETNDSNKRQHAAFQSGDIVIIRKENRRKYDPLFSPILYKVINVDDTGVTVYNSSNFTFRRHNDDVKM